MFTQNISSLKNAANLVGNNNYGEYDRILESLPSPKVLEIAQATYIAYTNYEPIVWWQPLDIICKALRLTEEQKELKQKYGAGRNRVIYGRLCNKDCSWIKDGYMIRSDYNSPCEWTERGVEKIDELINISNWDYSMSFDDFKLNLEKEIRIRNIMTKFEVNINTTRQILADNQKSKKDNSKTSKPKITKSGVYFIQNEVDKKIKIGFSEDIVRRKNELQTGSSGTLKVLGYINDERFLETKLHGKFSEYHHRQEWYNNSAEILQYIFDNCEQL